MEKVSLEISREKNLSEIARHFSVLRKSHKEFNEKDEKWNEKCMRWSRNSVEIYFGTISFICLNPLVPRVPNLPIWKTLSRGYKRWTPSTNGLKETILGVIISDGRWNSSSYSLFSDFQYHLILSITAF